MCESVDHSTGTRAQRVSSFDRGHTMSGIGVSQPTGPGQERPTQTSLFDPDGLSRTARLSLGWIIFLCCITGCLVAVPIGVYLGLWLMRKGYRASVLAIYSLVACSCVIRKRPKLPSGVVTTSVGDFCGSDEVSTCFQVDTSSTGVWQVSGGLACRLERGGQVPRQQVVDSIDGMIGNSTEHGAQVELRIESVELGRADQRIDGGGPFAS